MQSIRFFINSAAEESFDLDLGVLQRIGAVDEILGSAESIIAADGAGSGLLEFGGAHEYSHAFYRVRTFDYHRQHGTGSHKGNDFGEEGLVGQVRVMLLKNSFVQLHGLGSGNLIAFVLDTADDSADQASFQRVGLEHDISSFH